MLRKLRIAAAVVCFALVTLLFLDFTGTLHAWFGWLARIQFLPALLAVNVGVVAALVVATLLFGRIYCSVVCPLGVMQDGVSWAAGRHRRALRLPLPAGQRRRADRRRREHGIRPRTAFSRLLKAVRPMLDHRLGRAGRRLAALPPEAGEHRPQAVNRDPALPGRTSAFSPGWEASIRKPSPPSCRSSGSWERPRTATPASFYSHCGPI